MDDSHAQTSTGTLRPVAFRPTLTDGLALSIKPILPGWEDMSIKMKNQGF